ncbi:hypothetical protein ACFL2Z_00865 [Candidatus Eisenbacteria bacterium]|uniref:Uncharacterized protein n=1 Tax=Eiseniibacteriota bacterium TaxID=2212470 RepID=A0ABV6YNE3_UNCEI
MAKKFMFVCFGILALVIAFHLGAQYGQAGYVDHTATGIISFDGYYVLLDDGTVWCTPPSGGWSQEHSEFTPPVPISQIKFWQRWACISTNDEYWEYVGPGWVNHGSPPIGPTSTQPTTWSKIKAEFGE